MWIGYASGARMVEFNLLSWRKLQQKYQITMLRYILLFSVLFPILLIFVAHVIFTTWEHSIKNRVIKIQQAKQTAHEEPSSAKTELSARILQFQRASVELLSIFGNGFGPVICLDEVNYNGQYMRFSGRARSATDLRTFFQEWRAATFFHKFKLKN